jgi:hypothetical protein
MIHERSLSMVKKDEMMQILILTNYKDPKETEYLTNKTKI